MSKKVERLPVIEQWCPDDLGHLYGEMMGRGEIRTSVIVGRDGDVITTKSGSRYKLGSPHPCVAEPRQRRHPYGRAGTVYAVIDSCIKKAVAARQLNG